MNILLLAVIAFTILKVVDGYKTFIKRQRKKIIKLFPNLVRRYDKYVTDGEVRAADYITHKIVISGLFILLTIIAMVLQGKFITLFHNKLFKVKMSIVFADNSHIYQFRPFNYVN